MSEDIHGPATHSETGGELWHYEWVGRMWCEREQQSFEWPEMPSKCPHCEQHLEASHTVLDDD